MCGIHGIIQLDGNLVNPDLLSRMGRVTTHRGPDDEGVHADGPCAIGMRRLSIIDLSGGHQPISSRDSRIWLVCNGEIYNFRELRSELEARGHQFKTHSDSEVVLYAYIVSDRKPDSTHSAKVFVDTKNSAKHGWMVVVVRICGARREWP